jgi:hypothetical protein
VWKDFDASGRELDREGNAVEPAADVGRDRRIRLVQREAAVDGDRSLLEECESALVGLGRQSERRRPRVTERTSTRRLHRLGEELFALRYSIQVDERPACQGLRPGNAERIGRLPIAGERAGCGLE